jgi:hypothetical protein
MAPGRWPKISSGDCPFIRRNYFVKYGDLWEGKITMQRASAIVWLAFFFLAGCAPTVESTMPQATDVPIRRAEEALKRAIEAVCPPPDDPKKEDVYKRTYSTVVTESSGSCETAAGHETTAKIRRFDSTEEARTAFNVVRGKSLEEKFHGFSMAAMEEDAPTLIGGPKEYRIRVWQTGKWLVDIRAFDKTPYPLAPDPDTVSEEIYKAGVKSGLWA